MWFIVSGGFRAGSRRVSSFGFRVLGFGFGLPGLGFRVLGSGFGAWGSGFGIWGFGCPREDKRLDQTFKVDTLYSLGVRFTVYILKCGGSLHS